MRSICLHTKLYLKIHAKRHRRRRHLLLLLVVVVVVSPPQSTRGGGKSPPTRDFGVGRAGRRGPWQNGLRVLRRPLCPAYRRKRRRRRRTPREVQTTTTTTTTTSRSRFWRRANIPRTLWRLRSSTRPRIPVTLCARGLRWFWKNLLHFRSVRLARRRRRKDPVWHSFC